MKKITPNHIHTAILLTNIAFMALAINTSLRIFYVVATTVAVMTVLFFFYIKLFAKNSRLFKALKVQYGILILLLMVAFMVAGHLKSRAIIQAVEKEAVEQNSSVQRVERAE